MTTTTPNITGSFNILFIINPGSGNKNADWKTVVAEYFKDLPHNTELFELPQPCDMGLVKAKIRDFKPNRVIAIGGDGTVKLVAECLLNTDIPIGIVPAGSANGLAKELGIPTDPKGALEICLSEYSKHIHVLKVNGELCIHLSDLGFNAFVVKMFESDKGRGMWGYIKAAWKVLWRHPHMQVRIKIGDTWQQSLAAMIVIANATRYGSGALINPEGKLDDELFEVVIVKEVSFKEIFKMMVTHSAYDKSKTQVYQTQSLEISSRRLAHFQVDGEYMGKVNKVKAKIFPGALKIILPAPSA